MTLRCLIIDDEPLAHDVLIRYLKDAPFLSLAGQCYSATQAMGFLQENQVDLLFLDIKMPKLKGLDFLRILQTKPLVIITSAYEEYALESFELDVIDYLRKPFGFDRFLKATLKAQSLFQLQQKESTGSAETQNTTEQHLTIKVDKRHLRLAISDIYYFESFGNYVKVWLIDEFHLTPKTLSSFEEQLAGMRFLRIHKQYIVAENKIKMLEGNVLTLSNGTELQVGKNHRAEVKEWMEKGI